MAIEFIRHGPTRDRVQSNPRSGTEDCERHFILSTHGRGRHKGLPSCGAIEAWLGFGVFSVDVLDAIAGEFQDVAGGGQ